MPDLVISHLERHSATLTLNLPEKRNPISPAMRAALIGALELLRKDASIRSVIVTGAGAAFCSGLDLETLSASPAGAIQASGENAGDAGDAYADALADSKGIRDFYDYLMHFPKPLIAAVNGPAVAGGAGLALICDTTILSDKGSFCFSEVRLGFVPAIVGVYLQMCIGFKRARELMLSARSISPSEALQMGLATAVVPAEKLADECAAWSAQFARNGPEAMASTKRLLAEQLKHMSINEIDLAVKLNALTRGTSECSEGISAFLRKEKPSWTYP